MKNVRISFNAEIEDDFLGELTRIVDHHLDYLVDLTDIPEIKSLDEGELEELD